MTTALTRPLFQSNEAFIIKNASGTYTFSLEGGWNYCAIVHAGTWSSGSVALNILATDGSTYVQVASWTTDGVKQIGALPAGSYELVVDTATGVSISLSNVIQYR